MTDQTHDPTLLPPPVAYHHIYLNINLHFYENVIRQTPTDNDPYWMTLAGDIDLAISEGIIQKRLHFMIEELRNCAISLLPKTTHANIVEVFDITFLQQQIRNRVFCLGTLLRWLTSLFQHSSLPNKEGYTAAATKIMRNSEFQGGVEIAFILREFLKILGEMKLEKDFILYSQRKLLNESIEVLRHSLWNTLKPVDRLATREWCQSMLDRYKVPQLEVTVFALEHLALLWGDVYAEPPGIFDWFCHYLRNLKAAFHFSVDLELRCQMWEKTGRAINIAAIFKASEAFIQIIVESDQQKGELALYDPCLHAFKVIREASYSSTAGFQNKNPCPKNLASFMKIRESIQEKLTQATLGYTKQYLDMSSFEMLEARRGIPANSGSFRYTDIDQLARRVAQLAVLHWKIWGQSAV